MTMSQVKHMSCALTAFGGKFVSASFTSSVDGPSLSLEENLTVLRRFASGESGEAEVRFVTGCVSLAEGDEHVRGCVSLVEGDEDVGGCVSLAEGDDMMIDG